MATTSVLNQRSAAVVRFVRAYLTGESDVVHQLFSADARASLPATVTSAEQLAVEIEDMRDVFRHVQVLVTGTHDVGSETWVEWRTTVTHVGALAVDGEVLAASGHRAALLGVTVAEFDSPGLITDLRQYWDYSDLRGREHE